MSLGQKRQHSQPRDGFRAAERKQERNRRQTPEVRSNYREVVVLPQ